MQAPVLTNQLLKAADNAGMFNRAIVDILKVRQKIKELVTGKFIWRGATCNLTIVNENNSQLGHKLHLITKRPEALFGVTFIVISPDHPELFQFVDQSKFDAVSKYVQAMQHRSQLDRYENINFTIIPTGTWALHPITKAKLPVFVGDYILEGYDVRVTHAHMGLPAHNAKDFYVAQQNNLEIKLVINSPEEGKTSSPQINKSTKQLMAAYAGDYDDCLIVNSDFLNGSLKSAEEKAIAFLQSNQIGSEYKEPLLYSFLNKSCSINDLQAMESLLLKEHKTLSASQQEMLAILMLKVQADFLSIVEQFLINAREAKELMIELIEESCALRKNNEAYLLKWARMNTTESEKTIFKRDINSFYNLCKFCAELIDFLGDFGSSCTHALENLKNIKNNK